MNYKEQLKHPKWQKKRLTVLQANRFTCEECGCEDKTLHVHHRFYKKGRMVWEYDNDVLQVLCEKCHKEVHTGFLSSLSEEEKSNIRELIRREIDIEHLLCLHEEIPLFFDRLGEIANHRTLSDMLRNIVIVCEYMDEALDNYLCMCEIIRKIDELSKEEISQIIAGRVGGEK